MEDKTNKLLIKILFCIIVILIIVCFVLAFTSKDLTDSLRSYFIKVQEVEKESDFIKIFNVGEGDSILIHSNSQKLLIDTGPQENKAELCRDISSMGFKSLDGVIISHLHEDHIGALSKISDTFNIGTLILPDLYDSKEDYAFSAKLVKNNMLKASKRVYTAVQGMVSYCGEFEITVVGYYKELSEENDRSVIMMVKYNDIKFLLMSDAEKSAEKELIADGINFDCDILKVAHHGSNSSTSEEFLKVATPKYAVISCGMGNIYGHPNELTLDRLKDANAEIHRTDLEGDITLYFNNNTVDIVSEKLIFAD